MHNSNGIFSHDHSNSNSTEGSLDKMSMNVAQLASLTLFYETTSTIPQRSFPVSHLSHHLGNSIALTEVMYEGAKRGAMVYLDTLWFDECELGLLINSVTNGTKWNSQSTFADIINAILLTPIAASAGFHYAEANFSVDTPLNLNDIRQTAHHFVQNSSPDDILAILRSLKGSNSVLPEANKHFFESDFEEEILDKGWNIYDVFLQCANQNTICKELTQSFPISNRVGYNAFTDTYEESKDLQLAIMQTFLSILAEKTDTSLIYSQSEEVAKGISREALNILASGGALSAAGQIGISRLEKRLNNNGEPINTSTSSAFCSLSAFMVKEIIFHYAGKR